MIIKNYSLNPNSFNICKALPIPSIVPAKVDCTYGNKKSSESPFSPQFRLRLFLRLPNSSQAVKNKTLLASTHHNKMTKLNPLPNSKVSLCSPNLLIHIK